MVENCPRIEPDRLFDGRLILHQPEGGHRIGTDAILLIASAPPLERGLIVDVGAGTGAVGLALAQTRARSEVILLEKNSLTAAFARQNVSANALSDRVRVVEADLFDATTRKAQGLVEAADLIVTNPPFLRADQSRISPDSDRAMAHMLDEGGIEKWLRASLALLRSGGIFVAIHRADALDALLAALGNRIGGLEILPVFPRQGEKAIRVILRGRKGAKTPLSLLPGLVLHGADGRFTSQVEDIHRRGRPLFEH